MVATFKSSFTKRLISILEHTKWTKWDRTQPPFLVMLLNNFRVLIFAVSSPYLMIQRSSLGQIPPSYILLTTFLPLKYKLSFWLKTVYCLKFIKNIYYTANDKLRISKAFKLIKLRFYGGQNSLRYTRCVKLQMISLTNLTFDLKEKFNSKLIMISSTKVSP